MGRSPDALNMKIGNLGRLDPSLKEKGITGLTHGSKMEEIIWDEFSNNWDELAYTSEILLAKYQGLRIEDKYEKELLELPLKTEREQLIKARVNQSFFRSTVLSSYDHKCCITGISIPDLLVASHIVPWSHNEKERLNPRNGMCLNALHDKAFDKGLITITKDFKIKVAPFLQEFEEKEEIRNNFLKYEGSPIVMPEKFLPDKEFIDYHNNKIFRK